MTAPDKMERNWILDAGTVQALTFIRLWMPQGMVYSDIIQLATTMLFDEIGKICEEEGVGMHEAIGRIFERYSERSVPIRFRVEFGTVPKDLDNVKEVFHES